MRLTMKFNDQNSITPADHKGSTLDLSTVKTTSDATPRTRNRIFGLKEAPTYYPTVEEFAEPIKYIQKITPEAEKFGIIKIVPPEGYKPDFCLNTEAFRFRTRIQKLNSMEGETRANVNYLEQLYKFHRLHGHPVTKVPQLDKRPIDLFRLKKEVAQRGGYHAVTQQKKWAEVGRVLGYTRKQCTSMSNALKTAYTKVILPYEVWLAQHKEEQLKATPPPSSQGGMKRADPPPDSSSNDSSNTFTGCEVCHSSENEDEILLCDGCDRGYHMQCLTPPLASVPKSDWYCLKCLTAAGGDYGFEDGAEYSLKDFQEKCDKFKTEWFKKPYREVSEEDCEDEFWRLVENPHETCEVEYGADLHSTHHGSGFSSLERTDKGVFCKDPWNLNMIPILPQSLFTHIKTDISGMMVPWLYIGMCFSAFCWHNEDHYTYSINYMHWGETKTWYGVPGSDTAKFEDTMRAAVPELFEQQPDLLFQLVTMLSPGRLLKENVNVYAVDQRPGQFVVTFPKAYHSGFNHGFNFCEAVNFAPPEWVGYGLECVKRYKQYRRQPCFSHDELLVTTAREDQSTETAMWLKDALADMQQRELEQRNQVKKRYPRMQTAIVTEELPEEQQQCNYCNAYAYLSQVGCECTKKVACLEHVQELCSCDPSKKTLRIRMTEEQMQELLDDVMRAAYRPSAWTEKVQQALEAQPRPTLKTLRHFLSEAEKFPVEEAGWLREHIEKVQAWIDEASKLVVRKHQHRRRDSRDEKKYDGERYKRIEEMLQQASALAFDAPEIESLQDLFDQLTEIKEKSRQVLQDPERTLEQCKELFERGTDIGADIPEMQQLETAIKRFEWWAAAPKAILDSSLSYDDVLRLIEQGKDCGIPQDCDDFKTLIEIEKGTSAWIERAQRLFDPKRQVTVQEIQDVLLSAATVPSVPELYKSVRDLATRASDTVKDATNILARARSAQNLSERPSAADLFRVIKSLQTLPIQVDEAEALRIESENVKAWQDKTKRLFGFSRGQKSLDTLLEEVLQNVKTITNAAGQQQQQQQQQQQPTNSTSISNSDKSQLKTSDVYCICRTAESGLMIECDRCHEWYHGPCVKVTRREAKSQTSYICPICDGSQSIVHSTKRPRLEDVSHLLKESETLLFVPQATAMLTDIVQRMQAYRSQVQAFCRSKTQLGMEDLPKILQHSRELEGLEVLLQDESEFLRQKIQNLSPLQRLPSLAASSSHDDSPPASTEPEQMDIDQPVYCVCRKPIDPNATNAEMIGCDSCHDWFHIDCVNLTSAAVRAIEHYMCPACTEKSAAKPRTPVIKLTLKPPVAPPSPQRNRKRKHTTGSMSPTEDRRTKRRSVSDELPSPWLANTTTSLPLTKQQQ